jgi:hypothetical protein
VRVRSGSNAEEREVTVGSISAHEAVVTAGLQEAAVIERNVNRTTAR